MHEQILTEVLKAVGVLGDPGTDGDDTKLDINEAVCEGVDWVNLAQEMV
jgi:hypothetical protein